jgi:hypothetical protein
MPVSSDKRRAGRFSFIGVGDMCEFPEQMRFSGTVVTDHYAQPIGQAIPLSEAEGDRLIHTWELVGEVQ